MKKTNWIFLNFKDCLRQAITMGSLMKKSESVAFDGRQVVNKETKLSLICQKIEIVIRSIKSIMFVYQNKKKI